MFSNLLTFLLGNFGILTKLQSMAGLEKYETLRKEFFFFAYNPLCKGLIT